MIRDLDVAVRSLVGSPVKAVTYDEPVLTIVADSWSFSTTSSWRLIRGGLLAYGWSHPDAADLLEGLLGLHLTGVTAQSSHLGADPTLRFSDGSELEVFSDDAIDPWSFHLPNMVYVGSPTDPECV